MPKENRLSDAIATYSQRHFTNVCAVQRALTKLDDQDITDLTTAMIDRDITNRAISQALADRDIVVSIESMKRHRRGDCACES